MTKMRTTTNSVTASTFLFLLLFLALGCDDAPDAHSDATMEHSGMHHGEEGTMAETDGASHHHARTEISSDNAPAAIGPYAQAVKSGGLLFLSGQIGLDPSTGVLISGGIEPETRQTLANIQAILNEANYDWADVVQVQVYLADLNDYAVMNEIYAETFGAVRPARAAMEVARLPRDARIEIMVTARQ